MLRELQQIEQEVQAVLLDLLQYFPLTERQLLVFGVSTSEVKGQQIGSAGSEEVAAALFRGIMRMKDKHPFQLAFQCCEHLNRAIVVERQVAEVERLTPVTAIPAPQAGGAMAAYAYRHLNEAVLVENVQADAGIDLGNTLIGMHLRPVAVPIRPQQKQVGQASVVMAKTRPKLIGGARTVYI